MSAARLIADHQAAGRTFEAAGVASFVREEGDGAPVVCLHGIPASSFLYRKMLPELAARGLRGVAFDLPGFGLAGRPEDFAYDWPGHGAWAVAALDALGIDRFHLVCHDYGGPVGFELCDRVPERIRSLTVLDTEVEVDRFRRPALLDWVLGTGASTLIVRTLPGSVWHAAMLRAGVLDPGSLTREESDAWLTLLRGGDGGRALMRTASGLVAESTQENGARYRSAVQRLDVPKQVVWGMADPVLPFDTAGVRVHEVVGGPLRRLPARHFLQEEQPGEIAAEVAALAGVTSASGSP